MKNSTEILLGRLIKSYIEYKQLPKNSLPVYKSTNYSSFSHKHVHKTLSTGLLLLDSTRFDNEIKSLSHTIDNTVPQIYSPFYAIELTKELYLADEHLNISSVKLYYSKNPYIDIPLTTRTYGIYWTVVQK